MSFIIRVVLYALLIIGIAYLVPGIAVTGGFWPAAVIAGIAFALLNAVIRAIIPNGIIFALVALVLNIIAFWIVGRFVPGFDIASIGNAVIGGVLAAVGMWIINEIF